MSSGRNYFEDLLSSKQATQQSCLDRLVEEINDNKEKAIYRFLGDSGSEDFLWSLVNLLSSDVQRIASNAAYVIGSLAETELGSHRVLSLTKGRKSGSIIQDLTRMLESEDQECVMNAAGTLGTLAETTEGRKWMTSQACITDTITSITDLLGAENNWTASNAALVLARLTISEDGCNKILDHKNSSHIVTRLIQSLGNDAAGRGMNAAFAIGRMLDMSPGKERLLNCKETEKMISSLCRMLMKGDMGSAKNACFAVSCLAMDADGNQRVLSNSSFQEVVNRLLLLLSNEDDIEAAWFSAMTLRTMSSHKRGVLKLRENESVSNALNRNFNKASNTKELNEEIQKTINQLRRLSCPDPPVVKVLDSTSIHVKWKAMEASCGMDITYKLFDGPKILYKGRDSDVTLDGLTPNTTYNLKLRASSVGDESPFSDVVTVTTEEDCPSAPLCLRVVASSPSQLRFAWNPPERANGVLRGYTVYLGDKILDTTLELSFIVGRLLPATSYTISVCANTSKGSGEKSTLTTCTDELGAHAPGRPAVTVIGRNEVHVTWNPPSVPLGRFFRFELLANKEVIYSGTDRSYKATKLIPDTDYSFTVCAITSEGRCESEVTKKRTHKDKSQNEPGRHKLKTHSFKAKEFQTAEKPPLEKAKTQVSITVLRQKHKKRALLRPSSCVSSVSEKSIKYEHSATKDGIWANHSSTTSGSSTTSDRYISAVLTGGPPKHQSRNDTQTVSSSTGQLSMFLNKSKTEFPIRGRPDKQSQSKLSIEPVTWNELFPFDDETSNNQPITRRQLLPRQRAKPVNSAALSDKERSFINVVRNPNTGHRSSLPRVPAIERSHHDATDYPPPPEHKLVREKTLHRTRFKISRRKLSSNSSDSSDEITPRNKETSAKLKPLSLSEATNQALNLAKSTSDHHIFLEDPKTIVARLKTPSKGYWSDHDAYPPTRKKNPPLAPINYKTFTGAHRPTKTFRQESPLVAETWLSELPSGGETNKYKFIPTQMRTQPVHLPKPAKLSGDRLDSLMQLDMKRETRKSHL
uniref:Uncharacterized protein LOC100180399 n=1 Tax=Phallusia mammillata TaxID=59560 RepID=A0A6F9DHF5_9ASCI|nr:uncharacterized protein LOC100180399 [Phallusia mammillata]